MLEGAQLSFAQRERSHPENAFIPCTFFTTGLIHLTAIWTRGDSHTTIPPTPLHLWGCPLSAPPSPRKPEVLLVPQSCHWGHQSVPGAAGPEQEEAETTRQRKGSQLGEDIGSRARSGRSRLLTIIQEAKPTAPDPSKEDGTVLLWQEEHFDLKINMPSQRRQSTPTAHNALSSQLCVGSLARETRANPEAKTKGEKETGAHLQSQAGLTLHSQS